MRTTKKKITPLDVVILAALLAVGLYLAHRLEAGLNYQWNWGVIPQYLMRHDPQQGWVPNLILQGLFTTIRLSLWATLLATIFGIAMGMFRTSPSLFKRMTGRTYVELARNLPPLVLVFIFYFFISGQIMPLLGLNQWARSLSPASQAWLAFWVAPAGNFSAFISAVVTLAVYEGAYITEIVRSGIQSVERGQWEAAHALGLSWRSTMGSVVLPQAFREILPPLAGQFISAIKDSAIVSVISIPELTFQGMELMAATYLTFEVWITIAALYLLLTLTCSLAVSYLERRLAKKYVI